MNRRELMQSILGAAVGPLMQLAPEADVSCTPSPDCVPTAKSGWEMVRFDRVVVLSPNGFVKRTTSGRLEWRGPVPTELPLIPFPEQEPGFRRVGDSLTAWLPGERPWVEYTFVDVEFDFRPKFPKCG